MSLHEMKLRVMVMNDLKRIIPLLQNYSNASFVLVYMS